MQKVGTDLTPAPSRNDHVRGSLEAPVVITEFADFQCPYCGQAYPVIKAIESRYGERVAVVFRHFPLSMHAHAMDAAEVAEEAAAQGKFWEMHDALFEHQQRLTRHDLKQYAAHIGLDGASVEQALEAEKHREAIEADLTSGEESGVPGTPALFINGYAYEDAVTEEALIQAIEYVLSP